MIERESVALSALDLPRHQLAWAVRQGLVPFLPRPTDRGPAGALKVSEEVAETLSALNRAGLHLRYAGKFIARFNEDDDLVLSPRLEQLDGIRSAASG